MYKGTFTLSDSKKKHATIDVDLLRCKPQQDLHKLVQILFCGPVAENAQRIQPINHTLKVFIRSFKDAGYLLIQTRHRLQ